MKKLALHWKILLGMIVGILIGIFLPFFPGVSIGNLISIPNGKTLVVDWIKPFGTIFINSLKLIAIPLIITSLITGVAALKDISKFSRIGIRTIGFYVFTTLAATTLGLLIVNLIKPSRSLSAETKEELMALYSTDASGKIDIALQTKGSGPLQPLVDIVPENIFEALTQNGNMLQVIFFVIFMGIGLILIKEEDAKPVVSFFHSLNEVIMKLIDLIMMAAPYGVLALMATLVVESPNIELFMALIMYSITVVLGLLVLIFVFYPALVKIFTKRSYKSFFQGIAPAQLLAFSTSSSAATLPVTMERVHEHLGVDEEVASFVLPVGATINMDGTSLYQAVAAVFIANTLGMELTLGQQITVIMTATLASIGSAAVPGAGMVMLVIVLGSIGVPEAGLALIFAVDRPLDMIRTVANVTSDSAIAMIIGKSLGMLHDPLEKKWDDHYPAKPTSEF